MLNSKKKFFIPTQPVARTSASLMKLPYIYELMTFIHIDNTAKLLFSKKMLVRYYTLLKEMKMNKTFIMEIALNCAKVVVTTYLEKQKQHQRP